MITRNDLNLLVEAANLTGFEVDVNDLNLLHWRAGIENHIPQSLPINFAAVYIFKWNDSYLKVGKVNSKSNARYQSQHYNPESSRSNLARTIRNEPQFQALLGDLIPGIWLKTNVERFNILIPARLGKKFVHFTEAFFILKCQPMFENVRA